MKAELEIDGIGGNLLVDSLKTVLAIHLLRNYCTTLPKLSSYCDRLFPTQVTLITDYIQAHLERDLRLAQLSAIVQISPYRFLRLFKKKLGVTPHQYILQCRVEQVKYLLQSSSLSFSKIAVKLGFCARSHLTRCFRGIVGKTPSQFRQP